MNLHPYSSRVLALCGLILIGMGLYFVLLRPALLPEDTRFPRRALIHRSADKECSRK